MCMCDARKKNAAERTMATMKRRKRVYEKERKTVERWICLLICIICYNMSIAVIEQLITKDQYWFNGLAIVFLFSSRLLDLFYRKKKSKEKNHLSWLETRIHQKWKKRDSISIISVHCSWERSMKGDKYSKGKIWPRKTRSFLFCLFFSLQIPQDKER